MSKDLYDIVADRVIEFCRKTWYYDCLTKFEISYDGKEWDTVTCVVECDVHANIIFQWDFCEGQKYIRNFRICHTTEAEPITVKDIISCFQSEISHWDFFSDSQRCYLDKNKHIVVCLRSYQWYITKEPIEDIMSAIQALFEIDWIAEYDGLYEDGGGAAHRFIDYSRYWREL